MKKHNILFRLVVLMLAASITFIGCKKEEAAKPAPGAAPAPSFSIAVSEYPSWSTFLVACVTKEKGELLVNRRKGVLGSIEKRWNVDLVVKEMEYDPCLGAYGAGECDAVCITNMDVLNPALSRKSVAILPTSTSFGADACIVTSDITDVKQLKTMKVYGLAKTVSEYCWARNLELLGESEKDYTLTNMDPGAAAMAMQQGSAKHKAIVVWNPFIGETLRKRKDVRVLFDSTTIPGEIIDMVVMAQASLDRPGGKNAACAIIDAYYTICRRLADPKTQDDSLVALGEKFSHLKVAAMRKVVRQTRFYSTPQQGISLFSGGAVFPWSRKVDDTSELFTNKGFVPDNKEVSTKTLKGIMPAVVDFCVKHDIVKEKPTVGYGSKADVPDARLRFDATYMKEVSKK